MAFLKIYFIGQINQDSVFIYNFIRNTPCGTKTTIWDSGN